MTISKSRYTQLRGTVVNSLERRKKKDTKGEGEKKKKKGKYYNATMCYIC